MNKIIIKQLLLIFLLINGRGLFATELTSQSYWKKQADATLAIAIPKRKWIIRGYMGTYIPNDIEKVVFYFLYDNPNRYKNKKLPKNLSGKDLRFFDFTGCHFTDTNLTNTLLTGAILQGTTCNYQGTFTKHVIENHLEGGFWYQLTLPHYLKVVAQVYPKLSDVEKAKLLLIASAFSRLPFYEGVAFDVKFYYWSFAFLEIKEKIANFYTSSFPYLRNNTLYIDADQYCWTTKYPKGGKTIDPKATHPNFSQYLTVFEKGLVQHECKSPCNYAFDYYKKRIVESIKSLEEVYPMIKTETSLQQEVAHIALTLSQSYQFGGLAFLAHYLCCQHRLVDLQDKIDSKIGDRLQYSAPYASTIYLSNSWCHIKK